MTDSQRERLEKQIRFILEIDKEKNILRQTHLTDHGRREDDAEHAWHMAVMTFLLQEYSNEKIDVGHTMMLCLVHDLVEIDAGDTYAYDEEGKKTQEDRESRAADRIFGLLPDDQKALLHELFNEFEQDETPEAHFAHAMDNFQPLLLNTSNGGSDWTEHGVKRAQIEGRQGRTAAGSKILYEKTEELLDEHFGKG
ncbi:MAG: HD domain-containing protein [Lachnospiraceae bacterium]|jgi:putative hydrolase of HD superfamily